MKKRTPKPDLFHFKSQPEIPKNKIIDAHTQGKVQKGGKKKKKIEKVSKFFPLPTP